MRLPLATTIQSRDGTLAKDSKLVNAFVETLGDETMVYKRPGLDLRFDTGSGQGQGLICWQSTFFAVRGNTLIQGPTSNLVTDGSTWAATGGDAVVNNIVPGNPAVVHNGKMYMYMYSPTELLKNSPDGITWTTIATAPFSWGGVTKFAFASLGGVLYAIESSYLAGGTKKVWKSVDDGANWTVATASASFSGRDYPGVTVHDSKIYVVGGQTGAASWIDDVWTSTDGAAWTQVTASGGYTARGAHGLCSLGTTLFLAGGTISTGYANDVWKSTNNGTTWTQVTAVASWTAREKLRLVPYNNRLYVIGGYIGPSIQDDVWSASSAGASWSQKTSSLGVGTSTSGEFPGTVAFSGTLYVIAEAAVLAATLNAAGGENYALTGAASLPVSMTQTSGAASTEYLVIKTTGKAWVLTFGQPGTLTQITDADYPVTTVPGLVYLDGYFFVMNDEGEIQNSDLEAPLAWNPLNFISAEVESDNPVAIAKHQNYLVAFKDTTTELFYDAANASGSPLARLSNAAIQIGCGAGYSVANIDGGLFFISKTRARGLSVHYFPPEAIQPVEIAPPGIQRILNASDLTTVHCFAGRIGGHGFYVVNLVTAGITLAYDLQSQVWAQWNFQTVQSPKSVTSLTQASGLATATSTAHGYSDGDYVTIAGATPSGYNGSFNITRVDANTFTYPVDSSLSTPATGTITATGYTSGYFPFGFFAACGGVDYVQHETSGKIYAIDLAYADDEGAPIDVLIRTPKLDNGNGERKSMHGVQVVGDQVAGNLLIRYSDDDYQTFSTYRPVSLAQEKAQVRRLGQFRRRAMDFRYTGSGKLRIQAIDADIEQGR